MYQNDKSSDSKVKFRQASNCCKRVFEAAKLAYANKTKESITSQKLWLSGLFTELLIVFSTKVDLLGLHYSMAQRCFFLHLINFFAEDFSKNSDIDDSAISLPVFPSRTNLRHITFL